MGRIMRKGMALTTVFIAITVAVIIVGSAFAFFSNVPDSTIITIGAEDNFSISFGESESGSLLSAQTPVSDNSGDVLGERFATVTISYTVMQMEDVTSITLQVGSAYEWSKDGAVVASDAAAYLNDHLVCRIYAEGAEAPQWGQTSYTLPDVTPGATGDVVLDVKLDLSEELAPPQMQGATLTVRVGISKS